MSRIPTKLALVVACQFIGVAHACMPVFIDAFPIESQQSSAGKGEVVPEILVKSVSVGRASTDAPCPDVSSVTLELEISERSGIDLNKLGFELSVTSGVKPKSLVIPTEPVSPNVLHSKRSGALVFGWLEDSSKALDPINLKLKINAITAQGARGKSTEFRVESP